MIPKGIEFLRGPRQTEEATKLALDECCAKHPNGCGRYAKECKRLQGIRATYDPRHGGWAWPFKDIYRVPARKRQTDEQKYCGTLPVLRSRPVISRLRENALRSTM